MHGMNEPVLAHNQAAATMWGLGGRAYDEVSFAISDALAHAAQRLGARSGDKVLDVATGTGWTARNVARSGASVTAIDISTELLAAARELSAPIRPPIAFQRGDAERLPFQDASFDRVISTFGVMFAADHKAAAAELARVCKPGGRLVLAAWVPDGAVAKFFAIIGKHAGGEPPEESPLAWGEPREVESLLGSAFDLVFERGCNHAHHDGLDHIWEWYARGFGPVRAVIERLGPERLQAFRRDVDAYHRHYLTEAGLLRVDREYLITIGTRR